MSIIPFYGKTKAFSSIKFLITFLALSSQLGIQTAKAQGDLFVNPKRIVFEGQKRSEEISLANTGNDTARYIISFVQIRMTSNGEFEQITQPDSGQYFADKYLRIFPRTVTLAPRETQIIKVQTYQKESLQAGEYRSHLYFRAVPKQKPAGEPIQQEDSRNLSIKLTAVFGITIPTIIRVGDNNTQVSLSDIKLETAKGTKPTVSLTINRTGNMSVYGDININHITPSGQTTRVGFIKGISLYTPGKSRIIKVVLSDAGAELKSGQLEVSYTGTKESKPIIFATVLHTL